MEEKKIAELREQRARLEKEHACKVFCWRCGDRFLFFREIATSESQQKHAMRMNEAAAFVHVDKQAHTVGEKMYEAQARYVCANVVGIAPQECRDHLDTMPKLYSEIANRISDASEGEYVPLDG